MIGLPDSHTKLNDWKFFEFVNVPHTNTNMFTYPVVELPDFLKVSHTGTTLVLFIHMDLICHAAVIYCLKKKHLVYNNEQNLTTQRSPDKDH